MLAKLALNRIRQTALCATALLLGAMTLATAARAEDSALSPNPGLKYWYPLPPNPNPKVYETDLCVYCGTPGGVSAAIQMKRMGKKSILFEFGRHVGGMTGSGLSATDVGNKEAIQGMARDFFEPLGWRGYKPSAAEKKFLDMLHEADVPIVYEHRLKSVKKEGGKIVEIEFENGDSCKAKIFLDASYEGDLLAKAGITYHVGREGNAKYNETINGVQFHAGHNFTVPIDPYKVEGDPKSGLLWGISAEQAQPVGAADNKVQAYNFRMYCTNAEDRIRFPKPPGYDANMFELCLRYMKAKPHVPFQLYNGDCNNSGGFSTDMIGMNYEWPDADYQTREKIYQNHVNYQQGLVWFCEHDERVPETVRSKVAAFGLPKGEFPETNGWPHQIYVREARRMVSDFVMTERVCKGQESVDDSIGMGSYNMDSHNCERIVVDGKVRNEGDVQIGSKTYPISYRSIVPKEAECTNLFVPVALSSTHISYGSIRMEPVFMILGQSAATAASMAIDNNVPVQKVEYAKLKEKLLADKQLLYYTAPAKKEKEAKKKEEK